MPEWHSIVQENATPSDASAIASSELPTVESIFTRSRNLRCKACRPSSSLRVVLAALASVAAIVILVFLCSHAYNKRAVQDFRTRRLASSDESDAPSDVCGEVGGEEEQPQRELPRLPNLPAGGEKEVPLKKRLLERVGEARRGGSAHEDQQQRQPQNLNEAAEVQSGSPGTQARQGQEQPGPSPVLVGSPLSSAQDRGPGESDAATRPLDRVPHQHAAVHCASCARQTPSMGMQQLRGQLQQHMRRMRRQLQQQRRWTQRQLHRFQQHLQRERRHRQQLEAQIQRVQGVLSMLYHPQQQLLLWHERQQQLLRQQQQQQQYLLQQQAHLRWMQQQQQQLSLPANEQQRQQALLQRDQEKGERSIQQQAQQVRPSEERTQRRKQLRPRREQRAEELPQERDQEQAWQPATQTSGQSLEDEWIEPQSPTSETLQPSTSQQALPFPAPLAAARPSTSQDARMPAIPGASAAPVASPAAAAAEASRQEAPGGPAAGTGAGSDLHAGDVSSATPTKAGESMHFAVPTDPHLRTPWSAESAGAAAAGTAATRAYAIPAVGSNSAIVVLSGTPPQVPVSMYEHPFVSLPQRLVSPTPASCRVDLRRAVTAYPGRRDVVTLLQMAYDLLSRRALCLDELKELALVAGALVEHGMNHQSVDLTHHQASRALERLGLRFLLMDAVVSTFIVLGQDPEPGDWKLFTDTISHAAPTGYFGESRVTAAYTLARELSAAIKTLKGGKRPAPADLFHLKRMLFCSPSSPARFRRPDFDRWRQGSRTDAQ